MSVQSEEKKIKEVFSFYRGLILDLLEQELGDQKNWNFIRARILKILSQDRGLEFKILEIINSDDLSEV